MQFKEFDWLSGHGIWAIIPCPTNMVSVRVVLVRFCFYFSLLFYILGAFLIKQLFNSVSVKVVDIYLQFDEQLLNYNTEERGDRTWLANSNLSLNLSSDRKWNLHDSTATHSAAFLLSTRPNTFIASVKLPNIRSASPCKPSAQQGLWCARTTKAWRACTCKWRVNLLSRH